MTRRTLENRIEKLEAVFPDEPLMVIRRIVCCEDGAAWLHSVTDPNHGGSRRTFTEGEFVGTWWREGGKTICDVPDPPPEPGPAREYIARRIEAIAGRIEP